MLSGSLGSTGRVVRGLSRVLGGVLGSSGVLALRQTLHRVWSGSLTSSGALLIGKIFTRSLVGSLGSSGVVTLAQRVQRLLAVGGSLGSSGLVDLTRGIPRDIYVQVEGTLRAWGHLAVCLVPRQQPAPPLRTSSSLPSPVLKVIVPGSPVPPLQIVPPKGSPPVLLVATPPTVAALVATQTSSAPPLAVTTGRPAPGLQPPDVCEVA